MTEHLDELQLRALLAGSLRIEARCALLEHLSGCADCADTLLALSEKLPLAEPPAGFEARVWERLPAARPEGRRQGSSESLRIYSLKVCVALAATLILLFSGALKRLCDFVPEQSQSFSQGIDYVTQLFKGGIFDEP
ncbi:MAG: hypothetical protein FWH26_10565 [Oscillospiraceae bacterium]|nr:hypothetical protein [Oscillospiraceae bacterium]